MSLYFMYHDEVVYSVAKFLFLARLRCCLSEMNKILSFFSSLTKVSMWLAPLNDDDCARRQVTLSPAAAASPPYKSAAALQPSRPLLAPPACVQSRNQCAIISALSFHRQRRSRRGIAMTRSPRQGSEMYSNVSRSLRLSRFLRLERRLIFNQADLCQKCSVLRLLSAANRHLLVAAPAKEKNKLK